MVKPSLVPWFSYSRMCCQQQAETQMKWRERTDTSDGSWQPIHRLMTALYHIVFQDDFQFVSWTCVTVKVSQKNIAPEWSMLKCVYQGLSIPFQGSNQMAAMLKMVVLTAVQCFEDFLLIGSSAVFQSSKEHVVVNILIWWETGRAGKTYFICLDLHLDSFSWCEEVCLLYLNASLNYSFCCKAARVQCSIVHTPENSLHQNLHTADAIWLLCIPRIQTYIHSFYL